ncbi:MAG: apolipoprotein N-acyltransferase [Verrucomicrobia bacterium]|nr:apolipoprotein N-acyltransferase [Verrucomicrobiota bacterium]
MRARLARVGAATVSGLLLTAAYAPFNAADAAWLALIPLVVVARYTRPRQAFHYGFWAGCIFWLSTLSWLLALSRYGTPLLVVICGWLLLSAYCAVYLGLFVAVVAGLWPHGDHWMRAAPEQERPTTAMNCGRVVVIPLIWVGFEYCRSTLFTGFAWNTLGVSQFRNLAMIQIAEWSGVYGVSAVLATMNAGLAITGMEVIRSAFSRGQKRRRIHPELMIALLVVSLCLSLGLRILRQHEPVHSGTHLRCAIIQGNIPQSEKWDGETAEAVFSTLWDLTERASLSAPDLLVWPETALPFTLGLDERPVAMLAALASSTGPLLTGAMEVRRGADGEDGYYNSSVLFDGEQGVTDVYRKRHLVPFGEMIPLENVFTVLKRYAPLGYSCTAGDTSTVFRLASPAITFSSLICFEDTVASLARESVRNGAALLINQTNDGWFEGTAAPVQHLSHGVFRSVENRVPSIRCANLGVSCTIQATGALDAMTRRALDDGTAEAVAYRVEQIAVPDPAASKTFYTRYGDWPFAIPCAVGVVLGLGAILIRERRRGDAV